MMVGLGIVLEYSSHKGTTTTTNKNHPQVINKTTMIKPYPPPRISPSPPLTVAGFLDHCSLCKQKLLPGKDIYMYKGDRAFCSVECRCRQIFMDEEESINVYKRDNCSLAAMKAPPTSSSSSSSSASAASRNRKGTRNRANGFAY